MKPTTKTRRLTFDRRLLKLAEFLEKLPRKRFNYSTWAGPDWGGKPDLSCGTTACALGWATAMPAFRKFGASLAKDMGVFFRLDGYRVRPARVSEAIFGLTGSEHAHLFLPLYELYNNETDGLGNVGVLRPPGPDHAATPKRVAKHIRDFVAWRKAQK